MDIYYITTRMSSLSLDKDCLQLQKLVRETGTLKSIQLKVIFVEACTLNLLLTL